MQPPWRNSLQPLAHMIAPHCSRLLLLARPDLPLKSKGGRPPSPTPALFYCLLWGRKGNTSRRLWLNLNVLGQNAGRQIGVGRKDGLCFFLCSILPVRSKLLINPDRVRPEGGPFGGRRSAAKRCAWKKLPVQSVWTRCCEWTVDLFTISFSNTKKPSEWWPFFLAEYTMF